MEMKDGTFALTVTGNRFLFQGKIERADYSELARFLGEAEKSVAGGELEIDFRPLEYLNSSGIRAIAVFFLESANKVRIKINPEITWQRVGLTPLGSMKGDGKIIVEVK